MVYFPRASVYGSVVNLETDQVGCIGFKAGDEFKISPNDTVQYKYKYRDRMRAIVDPAIARKVFARTKAGYDRFKDTLYTEYLEWTNSSEADKERLKANYYKQYINCNAYYAVKYMMRLLQGRKISHRFEDELLRDIERSLINDIKTEDVQADEYQGDEKRIRYLLKAYLALNKQQLDSLQGCSITEFGIQKRINHEFLAFFELRPLWHQLHDVHGRGGENSRDLDRQLWSDIIGLLDRIEKHSTFERVESRIKKWTYADAMLYGQKVITSKILSRYDLNVDLPNLPKSSHFEVTLDNTFDPNFRYDYIAEYNRLRYCRV
jgi:hypothetical protein